MIKNLTEIQGILEKNKDFIYREFRVSKMSIFGSYARNQQREDSDLDILIEYDIPPTLIMIIELREYLTNLCQIPVDIVTKPGLKKRIRERVLKEVVEI